jgi:S-adenosylmethionine:tRNA ribosyltransferase-isomerase
MDLSVFDYHLPGELVAQYPLRKRDAARLLILDRKTGRLRHDVFLNIGRYLPPKSLVIANDSRVIPARLLGSKARNGAGVEVFLLKPLDHRTFEVLLRPLRRILPDEVFEFPGGVRARLIDREKRIVRFEKDNVLRILKDIGHMPLPPYIRRPDGASDHQDYQTVYARRPGSVAAPTAGLHFTIPLIASLKREGHLFSKVTLHVGLGTFKPVEVQDIRGHVMHREDYEIPRRLVSTLTRGPGERPPVVAIGTTSARALESFARTGERCGSTGLFIYPGESPRPFRLTDILVTNFHLPRSSLLMLVSAFAGTDLTRQAYAEAVRKKYRFYSYGDAMIIL